MERIFVTISTATAWRWFPILCRALTWRSLALVVCRQAELVAHLHKSEACSAKELEDAIFAAGLPLTLHQAGEVSAYLAREFGLVDAEGHTGRGGVAPSVLKTMSILVPAIPWSG